MPTRKTYIRKLLKLKRNLNAIRNEILDIRQEMLTEDLISNKDPFDKVIVEIASTQISMEILIGFCEKDNKKCQ